MQSPNRGYVPELDQLRGFAALLVFYYHSWEMGRAIRGHPEWPHANPLDALIIEGHSGVALFMVLSGFILARGALGARVSYGKFLTNRVLRIFPLMTFLTVFAIYANSATDLKGIVAPFLLLANTQPRLFNDATELTGTVWTISVEFQFYLVAPFLFLFAARGGLRYLGGLLLLIFIVRGLLFYADRAELGQVYLASYYTIVGRITQFVIGIGLAYLWPAIERRLGQRRGAAMGVLLAGLAGMEVLSLVVNAGGGNTAWHWWMLVYREVEGLFWALVIAGYTLARPLAVIPPLAKLMTGLGLVSFSMYLLHWSTERNLWRVLDAAHLTPQVPSLAILVLYTTAFLPLVAGLSWLSYSVIEKPFLTLRRRYVEGGAAG